MLIVLGCTNQKPLSRDELRSELKLATSFAAETEMFIAYTRQGRPTLHFAHSHAAQLAEEVRSSVGQMGYKSPEAGTEQSFQTCKSELDFLSREIPLIPQLTGNDSALDLESKKVAESHDRLIAASARL